MNINSKVENIILRTNIITDLDILLIDEDMIVYFIGNTEYCFKYMNSIISKELRDIRRFVSNIRYIEKDKTCKIIDDDDLEYYCQAISKLKNNNNFILFFKLDNDFTEKEINIMESTVNLIDKFLN